MMNCLLVTLAVVVSAPTHAPEESLWIDDYGAALEATRASQKPLLIVIHDSAESEGQSQHVTNTQQEEAAELLAEYVLCRVDVTTDYGKRVADAFKVKQCPFTAIIDKTGKKIIYRKSGRLNDSDWVTALDTHKRGDSRAASRSGSGSSARYS